MKQVFSTFFIICTSLVSVAQDMTGSWQGLIPAGGKNIPLIFNKK